MSLVLLYQSLMRVSFENTILAFMNLSKRFVLLVLLSFVIVFSAAAQHQGATASTDQSGMSMEEYQARIKSDKLILVDFSATWCGPCHAIQPILDRIGRRDKSKVSIIGIDVDQNPLLSTNMSIRAIPLLVLYRDGKEVWRSIGLVDRRTIEAAIDANSK